MITNSVFGRYFYGRTAFCDCCVHGHPPCGSLHIFPVRRHNKTTKIYKANNQPRQGDASQTHHTFENITSSARYGLIITIVEITEIPSRWVSTVPAPHPRFLNSLFCLLSSRWHCLPQRHIMICLECPIILCGWHTLHTADRAAQISRPATDHFDWSGRDPSTQQATL